MKPKEALHEISTMVYRNTDDFEMKISKDCYKEIVKSLEKQIAKNPLYIDGDYDSPLCPNCGSNVINEADNDYNFNCCYHCGQALDWSDKK